MLCAACARLFSLLWRALLCRFVFLQSMNSPTPRPARPARPAAEPKADRPKTPALPTQGGSSSASVPVPLWQQLTAVAQALQAIRGGQSGTAAVDAVEPRLRPGVQALLFQVLRQLGRADALRSQLVARKPPPAADALLCTALALAWDAQAAPYEPFTLVNQAVESAKRGQATRGQASFINACLRRFLRERDALVTATDADPVARWNHPAWWIRRVQQDYPSDWECILQANNAHAPMALRVNQQKCTPAQYQQALAAINLVAMVLRGDQPASAAFTAADTWPMSALPARRVLTTPITLPMSPGPAAPSSATIALTAARVSSADMRSGK